MSKPFPYCQGISTHSSDDVMEASGGEELWSTNCERLSVPLRMGFRVISTPEQKRGFGWKPIVPVIISPVSHLRQRSRSSIIASQTGTFVKMQI